jgi:4-hydroxy-4-methyl-2-oxoglutarate aldolase
MFGELLGSSLRARGCAGLIIDAGVRDVADLTTMEFPVWSKAISAQGTVKATAGSVNIPVVCAGEVVYPGDVIVGDVDGVCVVRRAEAVAIAEASDQRRIKEEKNRVRLKAGDLGLDMYGLRDKLKALGVEWIDEAPGN